MINRATEGEHKGRCFIKIGRYLVYYLATPTEKAFFHAPPKEKESVELEEVKHLRPHLTKYAIWLLAGSPTHLHPHLIGKDLKTIRHEIKKAPLGGGKQYEVVSRSVHAETASPWSHVNYYKTFNAAMEAHSLRTFLEGVRRQREDRKFKMEYRVLMRGEKERLNKHADEIDELNIHLPKTLSLNLSEEQYEIFNKTMEEEYKRFYKPKITKTCRSI